MLKLQSATLSRIAIIALVPLVAIACVGPVSIRTNPTPETICEQARVGGYLAADARWGVGVRWEINGEVHGVVWPYGYSARREADGVVLLNRAGAVVAREGDRVVAGGSAGDDGVSHPCTDVHAEPPPG